MNGYQQTTMGTQHNQQQRQPHHAPQHTDHGQQPASMGMGYSNQAGFAYNMNEANAERAGEMPFIDMSGAYVLTIKRAQYVKAATGHRSEGLEFHTETDDGQQANYLNLYFQKGDGSRTWQAALLDALLWLAGLKGFNWVAGVDDKGQQCTIANELTGVRLGFVLQAEAYTTEQGKQGTRLNIRQVFDPATRCTMTEAKSGMQPEAVNKLLKQLGV
ncbi:hypothetical protein [Oceanobacter mangrovi]|uniref:hypothetical protein n=1 Tax=Oceanobacter mangrovi TaxID=2862510 RepID=UPI001C8CF912|nr:hypothetical protein [Oceanobacter mangrovi]